MLFLQGGLACLGVVVLSLNLATAYLLYKQSAPPATVGVPCAKQDPTLRTGVRVLAWVQLVVLACVVPGLMFFMLAMCVMGCAGQSTIPPLAYLVFLGLPLGVIAFLSALPIVALLYVRALDAPENATTRDCTRIAPGYRRALLWLVGVMGVLVLALVVLVVVGWVMQRGRPVSVGRRAGLKKLYGPGKTKRRTALRTRK
jgi:hypothetical protein